ncbi:MAG: DNA mismatch repair endonuclease MutL [Firmicutes bacterium]|nr:DNA mismatch repair endonuclease MutL [Bacillota bacterium]
MGKISRLPPQMANLIAAGEVVERPASVVKELVENAVDAGARHVFIEAEQAGIQRIVVVDDGCGISPQDAPLALERQATSKISKPEDLMHLQTLGFRGEALAAIASVAEVELTTREAEAAVGTRVVVHGGQLQTCEPAASPVGTRVEVRQLFYQTPARLKFLRTLATERAHLERAATLQALAHPDVAMRLVVEGREIFSTAGKGMNTRLLGIAFGSEAARRLIPFEATNVDFQVHGFVSPPDLSRSTRQQELFFVQHRPVVSPLLASALEEAYRGFLTVHSHPLALIEVSCDPVLCDPNVHPAKREVRISRSDDLARLLVEAVRRALAGKIHPAEWRVPEVAAEEEDVPKGESETAATTHLRVGASWPTKDRPTLQPASFQLNEATVPYSGEGLAKQQEEQLTMGEHPKVLGNTGSSSAAGKVEGDDFLKRFSHPLRALGQILMTYIVTEGPDGLYLIDQHAAAERVRFEEIRQAARQMDLVAQPLAIPILLELTPSEQTLLENRLPVLEQLGVTVGGLGGGTLMVHSLPQIEGIRSEAKLAEQLIRQVIEKGSSDLEGIVDPLCATLACHSCVRAGDTLQAPEIEELLAQWLRCHAPSTCPHGRPVALHLSASALQRYFRRVLPS